MAEINLHEDLERRIAEAELLRDLLNRNPPATHFGAVVEAALLVAEAPSELNLPPEVSSWVLEELDDPDTGALPAWQRYTKLTQEVPANAAELLADQPELGPALEFLYRAKKDLNNSTRLSTEGNNIGTEMHLVLVPWQAFLDNLTMDIPDWLGELRDSGNTDSWSDSINLTVKSAIANNKPYYRGYTKPNSRISIERHIENQIEQRGPWGVLLVQTASHAGFGQPRMPDLLTHRGQTHFDICGQHVDALGVIEWLALSLQADPATFSGNDFWLLANRGDPGYSDEGDYVPYVSWLNSRELSLKVYYGNNNDSEIQPRLAVMAPPKGAA